MKHASVRKPISVALSILMVLSLFGGMAFTAGAQSIYAFSGRTDGENTCGPTDTLPAVTGNAAYNATFSRTDNGNFVTWYMPDSGNGDYSAGGVTLTSSSHYSDRINSGSVSTFTAPQGKVFTGIMITGSQSPDIVSFPESYRLLTETTMVWDDGLEEYVEHEIYLGFDWTGNASEVSFNAGFIGIEAINFYLADATYTITWKNGDEPIEIDANVPYDETPEYNGNIPAKDADINYTYAFSGWTDGKNTYGPTDALPAVTGDVTYTATFTATPLVVINAINLIDAIGTVAYTDESKAKIDAARAAYAALTPEQQSYVHNYNVLADAEAAYAALALAADKAAFDAYKFDRIAAVQAMAEEGDSEAAAEIIADAAAAIALLDYDTAKTLDENKAAVDALANIADRLAAQRAADLYAAKIEFDYYKAEQKAAVEAMAQEGDSEAVAQIIAEAAAAIDALIYDEFYTLAENKATVDTLANIADRLAAQRAADAAAAQLAAAAAAFDAYKFNLVAAVQAMAQDGDSEAAAEIIADAAAAIALLDYDTTKTLDENKAAVDAAADIADALAAQRAADAAAAQLAADKAAFDAYKADAKIAVQDMTQAGDSEEAQQIIADAIAAIDALVYDEEKTLDENKAAVDAAADIADALATQRAADATPEEPDEPAKDKGACPHCGENHGNDIIGTLTAILHHLLYFIRSLGTSLFK